MLTKVGSSSMSPAVTERGRHSGRQAAITALAAVAAAGIAVGTGRATAATHGDRVLFPHPSQPAAPTISPVTPPAPANVLGGVVGNGGMHGEPGATARWWVAQTQNDCVLMSAADMVGQVTGVEPSEADITAQGMAETVVDPATGRIASLYSPQNGANLWDQPQLLAHYRVLASYSTGNTLGAIDNALDGGQPVAVSVDAERIWNAVWSTGETDPGHHDHVVVVTGVDETNGDVLLNDSGIDLGIGAGREERVPLQVFTSAWSTSDDAMVIATGREASGNVPSVSAPANPFNISGLFDFFWG